jgi:hypothetical protein
MKMRLRIRSNELDDVQLQSSALELRQLIESDTEAEADSARTVAVPGTKGDPVALGTLVLTFLSSGAAVSLFKLLQTWLARKRMIDLEATRPDGRKLVIKAEDIRPEQMAATQKIFEDFMK